MDRRSFAEVEIDIHPGHTDAFMERWRRFCIDNAEHLDWVRTTVNHEDGRTLRLNGEPKVWGAANARNDAGSTT